MTIKERAIAAAYCLLQGSSKDGYERVIEAELKNQQKQDIEKALGILSSTGYFKRLSMEEGLSEEVLKEQFKQAMEE